MDLHLPYGPPDFVRPGVETNRLCFRRPCLRKRRAYRLTFHSCSTASSSGPFSGARCRAERNGRRHDSQHLFERCHKLAPPGVMASEYGGANQPDLPAMHRTYRPSKLPSRHARRGHVQLPRFWRFAGIWRVMAAYCDMTSSGCSTGMRNRPSKYASTVRPPLGAAARSGVRLMPAPARPHGAPTAAG